MTKNEEKSLADSAVEVIKNLIHKKNSHKKNAEYFIRKLSTITDDFITNKKINTTVLKSLKELFDSFAIIDEFDAFLLIIDCYNAIKISLMKWERFADKISPVALEFKKLIEHFYEVIKDLYFYEIFGFFSTTVHPEDIPALNLPCKVFCGCAEGWQREPYLNENGKIEYLNVVRFQDPENREVPLWVTIDSSAKFLELREKCSLSDKQLKTLCNFVNHNRGSIILHNAGVLDSKQFFNDLELRDKCYKSKYCIEFEYIKFFSRERFPSGVFYVDMNDMTFSQAKKFYKKIWKEIRLEPENLDAAYPLYSLKIIKRRPALNSCCFCDSVFDGDGNSTWPIFYKDDGEKHRCCDECNEKYVIAARKDHSLIMQFRKQFGVDYTEYED